MESAMQQVYRQSSYYEGGTCGYADTSYIAQESALRSDIQTAAVESPEARIDRRRSFGDRLRLRLLTGRGAVDVSAPRRDGIFVRGRGDRTRDGR